MTIFWDSLFFVIFYGVIPMLLFLSAWYRYRAFKSSGNKSPFLARAALAFLTLLVAMLVVLGTVASLGERLRAVMTLENFLPTPWKLGIADGLLSCISLAMAVAMLRGTKETVRVAIGIIVTSTYLMTIWLWVVINPH